jgi:hypothetical protein
LQRLDQYIGYSLGHMLRLFCCHQWY